MNYFFQVFSDQDETLPRMAYMFQADNTNDAIEAAEEQFHIAACNPYYNRARIVYKAADNHYVTVAQYYIHEVKGKSISWEVI